MLSLENHQNQTSSDLDDFDDDELIYKLREKRIETMKKAAKTDFTNYGNGLLNILTKENELLTMSTNIPRLIILFSHPDFKRCQTMQRHLSNIAKKQTRAKFVCIDAFNAPFMAFQMTVKVLPCLIVIKDGHAVERLVGFEGLQSLDGEDFAEKILEDWLIKSNIFND